MDHLLAAFFAVVFAHPGANYSAPQTVELPTFASHFSVSAIVPSHSGLPIAVNRHPASYAVARAGKLHP